MSGVGWLEEVECVCVVAGDLGSCGEGVVGNGEGVMSGCIAVSCGGSGGVLGDG